jgi:hypothetical protein
MMQIELEKNNQQLAQYLKQKKELSDIDINRTFDKVEFGSLLLTNQGNYLSPLDLGNLKLKMDYSMQFQWPPLLDKF